MVALACLVAALLQLLQLVSWPMSQVKVEESEPAFEGGSVHLSWKRLHRAARRTGRASFAGVAGSATSPSLAPAASLAHSASLSSTARVAAAASFPPTAFLAQAACVAPAASVAAAASFPAAGSVAAAAL